MTSGRRRRLADGEELLAVVAAMWRRRGWVVIGTDMGLRMARRPMLFGRPDAHTFEWDELTAVETGPQRATLSFGPREVALVLSGPHAEFVRLIEAARRVLHGSDRPAVEELRALARAALGKVVAYASEIDVDALPDHLQPGERVEQLARASLDFTGLLVLTDRRLLLISVTARRAREREWSQPRDEVMAVVPTNDGLRLHLRDGTEITLRAFNPGKRRLDFAAALG